MAQNENRNIYRGQVVRAHWNMVKRQDFIWRVIISQRSLLSKGIYTHVYTSAYVYLHKYIFHCFKWFDGFSLNKELTANIVWKITFHSPFSPLSSKQGRGLCWEEKVAWVVWSIPSPPDIYQTTGVINLFYAQRQVEWLVMETGENFK